MTRSAALKTFCMTLTLCACYQSMGDDIADTLTEGITENAIEKKAGNMTFSRVNFGYSPLPIWSPLTDFEASSISQELSKDRQDLLAIYLIAGGEIRSQDDFDPYQQEFDRWLLGVQSTLNEKRHNKRNEKRHKKRTDKQKAAFLFESMYKHFFKGHGFSQYHADQSQVSKIFDDGTYNCISSAMLFIAAAERLDLEVSGVLIPSHAFVQLTLPRGEVIDIETTSLDGFDINHDAKFYEYQAREWASERELDPPSFQDYLDREIISPLELGLLNMWSQHTSKNRMVYSDRLRLSEIRSHLSTEDQDAHINRLVFYLAEFAYLDGEKDYPTLLRLFRKIEPFLRQVTFLNNQELQALRVQLQSGFALTLMKENHFSEGLMLAKSALIESTLIESAVTKSSLANNVNPLSEQTENILFYAMDLYARNLTETKRFEEARSELLDFSPECRFQKICQASLVQVYLAWAQQYWVTEDWEEVTQLLNQYAGLFDEGLFGEGGANKVIRENLATAYTNWAQDLVFDGDWEIGVNKLNTCLEQLPGAEACQKALDRIARRYKAGFL